MKSQFQAAEVLKVRLPPFINKSTGSYIIGSDTCSIVVKKPSQGSGVTTTYNSGTTPAVSFDADSQMWLLDIPTSQYEQGEWRIRATSNDANAIPQWRVFQWGDYVDDITTAKNSAATAATQSTTAATEATLAAKILEGRWRINGTQLFIFDLDGTTVLRTYDLKDDTGSPSVTKIFERTKL